MISYEDRAETALSQLEDEDDEETRCEPLPAIGA